MARERFQHAVQVALALALGAAGCGIKSDAGAPSDGEIHGTKPKAGAPSNAVGGFSIQLPEITLAPGDEQTPCWVFPLDLQGPSHFVNAAVLRTTAGLHHGNITTRPKTGEGIRPCDNPSGLGGSEAIDVVRGGSVLFGSSTQVVGEEWRHFANNRAYRVKDGYEIVARMHYLNTTDKPLTVAPSYEWYTIPESDVTDELGPIFWDISGFTIPPKSTHSESADCYFYKPLKIVEAMPHMHALGTHFGANVMGGPDNGTVFLDEKGYDPDGAIRDFDPPVDLSAADGVHFSCTWQNAYNETIVEGIGKNEMCMMFGYGYPAANAFSAIANTANRCVVVLPPDPAADAGTGIDIDAALADDGGDAGGDGAP